MLLVLLFNLSAGHSIEKQACGMGCVLMLKLWLRQIDEFEYAPTKTKLEVPDDEDRRDRTDEEMANEAATLRQLF